MSEHVLAALVECPLAPGSPSGRPPPAVASCLCIHTRGAQRLRHLPVSVTRPPRKSLARPSGEAITTLHHAVVFHLGAVR